MAAVKRHLHNYVDELPYVILNTAHAGYDDEELVELFRTQVMLKFDDLGHGTIRYGIYASPLYHVTGAQKRYHASETRLVMYQNGLRLNSCQR